MHECVFFLLFRKKIDALVVMRQERSRTLMIVAWIAVVAVASASTGRHVRLEHVYCDPMTEEETAREGSGLLVRGSPPSMVAKAKCKGASCPSLNGKRVVIEQCRWSSVNNKAVFVEETSGWYHFYLDVERTLPLRPSEAEIRSLNSGEVGYLRHQCGVVTYDAE